MEARDRRVNLALFGIAALAWVAVGWIVMNLDPGADPTNGFTGAGVMGLAMGLTTAPLFWLVAFGRQRRIAYRGDWVRALRRGAWVAALFAVLVVMRLEGIFQPPIALFLVAIALVAEMTLSAQR
jgi:NADH:ubiquinone oxidoreductase subunit 4 (subunit M)